LGSSQYDRLLSFVRSLTFSGKLLVWHFRNDLTDLIFFTTEGEEETGTMIKSFESFVKARQEAALKKEPIVRK
jgi:hypothetical protein